MNGIPGDYGTHAGDAGEDIVLFQFRAVVPQFLAGGALAEQVEQHFDGDSHAAENGLAVEHAGAGGCACQQLFFPVVHGVLLSLGSSVSTLRPCFQRCRDSRAPPVLRAPAGPPSSVATSDARRLFRSKGAAAPFERNTGVGCAAAAVGDIGLSQLSVPVVARRLSVIITKLSLAGLVAG